MDEPSLVQNDFVSRYFFSLDNKIVLRITEQLQHRFKYTNNGKNSPLRFTGFTVFVKKKEIRISDDKLHTGWMTVLRIMYWRIHSTIKPMEHR